MTHHETGISVTGKGIAETAPDMARVDLGVSVRADSVAAASGTVRERAASLIAALQSAGVASTDIATTGYNVHPEYDHHEGGQRLLGYRVSNDLQAVLRDLATSGAILDAAMSAAGDEVTVNGFTLAVSDDTEARSTAREAAWADTDGTPNIWRDSPVADSERWSASSRPQAT